MGKPGQYMLVAFLYFDHKIVKVLTEEELQSNRLKSGTRGRAIVEQRNGERAVLYGVQFQRVEMRPTGVGSVYVCVLKAVDPFSASVGSSIMADLAAALRQWKEVYILWKRVPARNMNCYACDAPLRNQSLVLFENSMPVCTAYCSLFRGVAREKERKEAL